VVTRRLAYADPPYPGQAGRYHGGTEVDLRELIAHLRTFDAWALSTSSAALRDVWNLCPEARVGAWAKTYAVNGWSRVAYTWEPVLFDTDRKKAAEAGPWDSLVAAPVHRTRQHWADTVPGRGGGVKPAVFTAWLLDLLGFEDGDEFSDLFPGSGAVSRAVRARQGVLL
jgi:hypothetical protein